MEANSASHFWDKYIAISKLYKVSDSALRWKEFFLSRS